MDPPFFVNPVRIAARARFFRFPWPICPIAMPSIATAASTCCPTPSRPLPCSRGSTRSCRPLNSRFEIAAIAIFVAMVLDGMDGRVARLTNTQSAFGEQYDSLSDMTSFGVAAALVAYEWILQDLGRWGWLAAFVYVAGAALRLAALQHQHRRGRQALLPGAAQPAAAALVAGFVWLAVGQQDAHP